MDTGAPAQRRIGETLQLPENFFFHKSDVTRWLQSDIIPSVSDPEANPTTLIFDPPREGLGNDFQAIESILSSHLKPSRILYVGCDVDSFARDVFRFTQKGYSLKRLGILDLFPQTIHLESLALLTL